MVLEGIVPEGQRATVLQLPALGGPERAEGKMERSEPKRRSLSCIGEASSGKADRAMPGCPSRESYPRVGMMEP